MEKGTIKLGSMAEGNKDGSIGFKLTNLADGTPVMILVATVSDGKSVILDRMAASLEKIRLLALPAGKADVNDVCKKVRHEDIVSLEIPLALGGADVLCLEKTCHDCLKRCKCK